MSTDLRIEEIRKVLSCPSLEIHMSPLWGANTPEHRFKIRQFLLENVRACGGPEKIEDLLDLKKVPVMASTQLSIAHCDTWGAVAFAQAPVGIDIESQGRVSESAAQRMSSPQELALAPSSQSLWVAKEAAYKALYSFRQPGVMSHLETHAWQKLDSQIETFSLANHQKFLAPSGKGVVIHTNTHSFAIFIFQT